MEGTKPTKTIAQVFKEFLGDKKDRISAKTFSGAAIPILAKRPTRKASGKRNV